ncbi:hypothetical protein Kpol_1055p30 [Vanderwaltozyma polyspora DSM 70294]|uniref:Uncharacterized protein n=1 Tax=Vanderwaltozyma polyspora (strain ATCC 22028 / DSM 70294 / BCRC 21397 / CBS 2163 / NBRC 10782 / NRRL Y-8283 / UCD 57-17) TaxID=436907 RepID=A7TGA5_VANPO|nr:uncharacterized protein Kpol_1055p30 [Vanderwaltozyma polyspora DSM 70294]EDO18675.1 hypothetical protein Kpol_1055p30 [Vanderwaltozyma polyspora DSM 70294]
MLRFVTSGSMWIRPIVPKTRNLFGKFNLPTLAKNKTVISLLTVSTGIIGLHHTTSFPHFYNSQPIYNDIAVLDSSTRFESINLDNRRAKYREMCVGSVLGLVSGVIIGKISTVLAYVTVFSLLAIEWLSNKGIIDKSYLYGRTSRYLKHVAGSNISLDKPFFKVPFLLTFFISSLNI